EAKGCCTLEGSPPVVIWTGRRADTRRGRYRIRSETLATGGKAVHDLRYAVAMGRMVRQGGDRPRGHRPPPRLPRTPLGAARVPARRRKVELTVGSAITPPVQQRPAAFSFLHRHRDPSVEQALAQFALDLPNTARVCRAARQVEIVTQRARHDVGTVPKH